MRKILTILLLSLTLKLKSQNILDSTIKNFVYEWIGRPYKFGGTSKNGIDCSALVQNFYKSIFGIDIPRTCYYQFKKSIKVSKNTHDFCF